MTTDPELRHLLEMAAKACRIHLHHWFEAHGCYMASSIEGGDPDFGWCPDEDDGDSARMRTALLMDVKMRRNECVCVAYVDELRNIATAAEKYADHNGDRNAALRLCALRVAAEIGEGMK